VGADGDWPACGGVRYGSGMKRNKGREASLTTRRRVGEGLGDGDVVTEGIDAGGRRLKTMAATLD
jgi:hypothetical protein